MNNFPFEHNGETLWYSRSMVCSMYLFVYERQTRKWYILMNLRGPGCVTGSGKWNVPGGYLDFGETLEGCARRECGEETGIYYQGPLTLVGVDSRPGTRSQNVIFSFYGTTEVDDIENLKRFLTNEKAEKGEVLYASFFNVNLLKKFPDAYCDNIAFGHDEMIRKIFKEYINAPFWRRWRNKITVK